ncbi:DUF6527 family protein [Sphingomonas sp. AR_OL41]|uniref:DUF6527 family protein n=1 Tax=Sphingomonas sp. AR_OL41 TaxID=3042729 RepID=UPI0024812714|nr:DUF6527 family protein [Sphingomonas sp. AR_OL41]MDH7972514.1 DUF6527 family protein [Sphingomonas sp. AR_OL41]
MPDTLEDGVIYVSERYRIALHSCCCGCGEEVSTPLGPTEYSLRLEPGGVTVEPSIGNHDFACTSHYLIERGSIVWAGAMSRRAINAGRAHDRYLKRGLRPRGIRALAARVWTMVARLFG